MLKFLGVSRSGYLSFLNRKLSASKQRKEAVKKKIQKICDNSKQNYGAPKITQELRKSGETIAQRTVGKYMREMGIALTLIVPTPYGALISLMYHIINCNRLFTINYII